MKSLKLVLQKNISLQLLVASVGLTIYLPIARLDPDPHHDGIQIATAIGVGSGRAIHHSVFLNMDRSQRGFRAVGSG